MIKIVSHTYFITTTTKYHISLLIFIIINLKVIYTESLCMNDFTFEYLKSHLY